MAASCSMAATCSRPANAELIDIRRHKMSMVFQHFALLPHLTVLDNIAFPLAVQGVGRARREARARELIDLVGLTGRDRYYPRELSGGQQQRVGIARSLAVEPEIWFLDEPFSALDPLIRREMQDELLRLQGVLKKTMVFITHDFDEAIRLADRIAIMKDGAVIQIATPEELVLRPATDYVAAFTRHVNRAKVMTARSLMQPITPGAGHSGSVAANAKIASFAAAIVGDGQPFAVIDDGRPIGEVTPRDSDRSPGRARPGGERRMTVATLPEGAPAPVQAKPMLPLGAALGVLLAVILISRLVPAAADYPAAAILPAAEWIGALFQWLKTAISGFTRGLAAVMAVPLDLSTGLLAKGLKLPVGEDVVALPRLSWLGIILAAASIGHALGGVRMALIGGLGFLYIAVFRQWDSAMLTLALIAVCVPLCVVLGMVVGIWGYASPRADRLVITPALDLMQTIPTFAYLIPMLLLFGISPVSALLATGLFATPPMVRATMLGLRKVKPEIKDFADMAGCTALQKLWRVLIPSAKPSLMIGVNQVIMLALNMVIISSMIGAGGLGYDVLLALRAAGGRPGDGSRPGDRRRRHRARPDEPGCRRRSPQQPQPRPRGRHLMLAAGAIILTTLLSLLWPALAKVPAAMTLSTAPWWKAVIDWVTVNYFDALEIFRTGFLLHVLNPLRALFEGLPWFAVVGMLAYAGWRLGGWGLALLVAVLTSFCAATGLWVQTMATVYLCGVAALISAIIGIPIGVLAAQNDRIAGIILPIIDTLQTIPSFCFIIPVVMLFRVGDVTAVIATVAFAIVPAIRYTDHGLRQVPEELIEAGRVSGCTRATVLPGRAAGGLAGDPARHQSDDPDGAQHDHHLRHDRHPGSRPGGVQGAGQGGCRQGHRRRPVHRLHRHRGRPADHRLGGAAQMVKA